MNKQDLISKIKQLDGISQDERAYLINLVNTKKKYGLVWEDKPEAVEEQLRDNLPVLKEVKDKAIINGEDNPNHILIEGDNLHALTALTFTHEGKIDVIYIDPPYNTGNKDFKYNDTFVDKEDSYRHSKWLSFMDKRLRIAKRLLSDKGVVFISIDDNEQAQLRLLCNEVLGEDNFITNIIWQKKTGASDAKTIDTITEYISVFTKSNSYQTEIFNRNRDSYDLKRYRNQDEYFEHRGPYYLDSLDRGGLRYSDSLNYGIKCPDGTICFPNGRTEFINDGWTWKWGKSKLEWGIKNKFIDFRKADKKASGWTVCYKNYLNVDNENNLIDRSAPLKNMIIDIKNADAAADIKEIFTDNIFKYTKPVKLIQRIINFSNNSNSIILDFFAGSGTTLHATMALNAEDGGNRQCILVTNNENNICEEVTYERNKRVIQGYTNAKGVAVEGLKNNNLRYYKSEFVSRDTSLKNKRELTYLATELLCIKEDCYTAFPSKEKWFKAFTSKSTQFIVIYDEMRIEDSFEIIEALHTQKTNDNPVKVYVFSHGQYPFTEDFEEVLPLITLCALPDAIYKAYQNVLPKKKREVVPVLEEDAVGEEENLFNQDAH
ncbi:site-specific DNA-methyltransferase [Flavobacterium channae]|uniref:site-specific DNA-methyltransferase n=1 Tax=Flavobacterium channae TaxID=2897181 RepID=UPI001E38EA4B|nr:site-specific DNA-methyltransferase [Flavobacterium channae]UGS24453.1 site-specific DNA-methyltransferase [Flavobacterium channae]